MSNSSRHNLEKVWVQNLDSDEDAPKNLDAQSELLDIHLLRVLAESRVKIPSVLEQPVPKNSDGVRADSRSALPTPLDANVVISAQSANNRQQLERAFQKNPLNSDSATDVQSPLPKITSPSERVNEPSPVDAISVMAFESVSTKIRSQLERSLDKNALYGNPNAPIQPTPSSMDWESEKSIRMIQARELGRAGFQSTQRDTDGFKIPAVKLSRVSKVASGGFELAPLSIFEGDGREY